MSSFYKISIFLSVYIYIYAMSVSENSYSFPPNQAETQVSATAWPIFFVFIRTYALILVDRFRTSTKFDDFRGQRKNQSDPLM